VLPWLVIARSDSDEARILMLDISYNLASNWETSTTESGDKVPLGIEWVLPLDDL